MRLLIDHIGQIHPEPGWIADLPSFRKEKLDHYLFEQEKKQCLLGWKMIEKEIPHPERITFNPYGKMLHPECFFSLSHDQSLVFLGVSQSPIGCDIERIKPVDPILFDAVLGHDEKSWLMAQNDQDIAFLRLWTIKEAFFKMMGTGLVDPMDVRIDLKNLQLFYHNHPQPVGIISLCYRDYLLAVVFKENLWS